MLAIIYSTILSAPFSVFSHSGTPIMHILVYLMVIPNFLGLFIFLGSSSFFFFLFFRLNDLSLQVWWLFFKFKATVDPL